MGADRTGEMLMGSVGERESFGGPVVGIVMCWVWNSSKSLGSDGWVSTAVVMTVGC